MPMVLLVCLILMAGSFSCLTATELPAFIELERAIHFVTPGGDDVVVQAGTYEVEGAEAWLRLIPKGGAETDAVLLAAMRGSHPEGVSAPQVRTLQGGGDETYLWLTLPDGKTWAAKGSYSGVRTRQAVTPTLVDARLQYMVEYDGPTSWDSLAFANEGLEPQVSLGFCLTYAEKYWGAAWTWYPDTQRCRIFNSITVTRPNASVVSGIFGPAFLPHLENYYDGTLEQTALFYPYFNSFLPEGGYKQIQGTLSDCHVQCSVNGYGNKCKGFSWNKQTNTCYFRDSTNNRRDNSQYISGVKMLYPLAVDSVNNEITARRIQRDTAINLPTCIQVVLHGSKKQYVSGIFGLGWNCAPVQLIPVHSPDFMVRVLTALYKGVTDGSSEVVWFNKLASDLKLASSPPNTQLMVGYVSHPVKLAKNDVAYYIVAASRVSVDETVIHGSRIDYRAGGIFNTPFVGMLLEIAIQQAVSYLTGGIPFSGDLALYVIKKMVEEGAGSAEGAANKLVAAIALSAGPILPMPSTTFFPAILPLY